MSPKLFVVAAWAVTRAEHGDGRLVAAPVLPASGVVVLDDSVCHFGNGRVEVFAWQLRRKHSAHAFEPLDVQQNLWCVVGGRHRLRWAGSGSN